MNEGRGSLFVIAAPSGVGKSTLVARLMDRIPGLRFSVSCTSRAPRAGETDGREYRFVGRDDFERMVEAGEFLEWAEVHGELYGTVRTDVETMQSQGLDVLLDIDVQGAAQVRESTTPSDLIFVLPPDYATLESRLRGRRTESARSLDRRLGNAAREVRAYDLFDFLIVNDDLDRATDEIVAIVTAARCRMDRREAAARRVVATFPEPGQDG